MKVQDIKRSLAVFTRMVRRVGTKKNTQARIVPGRKHRAWRRIKRSLVVG